MSLLVVLLAVASVVGFAGAVVGCVSSCVMVSLSSSCRYELPVDGSLYATYALLATLRISAVLLSGAETMIWKPSRGSTASARLDECFVEEERGVGGACGEVSAEEVDEGCAVDE